MYEHFKEASLPLTYRREAIECLIRSVALQRSVRLVGLSGMGKSNLLRFLVSHPRLLQAENVLPVDEVCLLYIDCNKLHPVSTLNFYRECNFRIQNEQALSPGADEYLLYKQLESTLRSLAGRTFVILVIDRFEVLYNKVDQEFFGQLRNLRDEARSGRLSFIIGSQRPGGDFHDIERLFSDTCWVGPLKAADRAGFFERHGQRLQIEVNEPWRQLLWRVTGAHPGLLKNAIEWLKRYGADKSPDDEHGLIAALLSYAPTQKHCRGLWESLSEAEKDYLYDLKEPAATRTMADPLNEAGLILEVNGQPHIFSPLWETYLRQSIWAYQEIKPMHIELDPATRGIVLRWRSRSEQTTITRDTVFRLLELLLDDPGKVYDKDELIQALYQAEKVQDVYDDALFQLITSLRKSLDPFVKRLCPAMTGSCIQNVRGVGYRLVVDLPMR
jgi:DNA-binding winged helix-turn-helix (wHTH) protein